MRVPRLVAEGDVAVDIAALLSGAPPGREPGCRKIEEALGYSLVK